MHAESDMFSYSFVKLLKKNGCFKWKLTQTEGVSFLLLFLFFWCLVRARGSAVTVY